MGVRDLASAHRRRCHYVELSRNFCVYFPRSRVSGEVLFELGLGDWSPASLVPGFLLITAT